MAPYKPVPLPTHATIPANRRRPKYEYGNKTSIRDYLYQQIERYLTTYRTFRPKPDYKQTTIPTYRTSKYKYDNIPSFPEYKHLTLPSYADRIPTYRTFRPLDLPEFKDFTVPTYKPSEFNLPSPTTTNSSQSSLGPIGIAISVIVTLLSLCCYCLKFYARCKRRFGSSTRTTGVVIRQGHDGMNRPLLTTVTRTVPDGERSIPPPLVSSGEVRQYNNRSVQPNIDPGGVQNTTANRDRPARRILPRTILRPTSLTNPEDDTLNLILDPPPEPDANNPYSVEAITDLCNLHRTREMPVLRIEVDRDTIVEDVIKIYQGIGQNQAHRSVFCKFKGEDGLDAGGVMKDLYTTFWDKAKDVYFKGNVAYVPQINLRKYDLSEFVTLGRIFSHSTVLLRAVPLQICRTTLIAIIFGEMDLDSFVTDASELIEDFLLYLDLDDRLLIQKAMKYFNDLHDSEITRLQYIFETFDMTNALQKETLEANLSIVAYNELYVKPRAVCQKMGKGIPTIHRDQFWGHLTFRHIDALYEVFKPSPNKVTKKLLCANIVSLRLNERLSFRNLKRFIADMSEDLLLRFLQFVTGERKVPCGLIIVRFNDLSGVARAPKSHTCINMLELPCTYTRYSDLKREFTNILMSEEAMRMNME